LAEFQTKEETSMNISRRERNATSILAKAFGALALVAAFSATSTRAGEERTFIVLYKADVLPADAVVPIQAAGGSLVYGYPQIGVAIARSADPSFAESLRSDASVEGVAASGGFASRLRSAPAQVVGLPQVNVPADDSAEPFFRFQWNMRQIKVPEAHAITRGSPAVVVGDIDTGVDFTHPDLAANIDFGRSVSCIGGVPNRDPAAWRDDNGHGTHTAGIIAAGANGIGIVGVAPNTRLAAIKAGDADSFFFPEAVICAFVWAAENDIAVTNNSYFADPWLFNCKNDPEQRAIWEAERRAIRYALSKNVTVVSILHNQSDDLAHPQVDFSSPDFPEGSEQARVVTNACAVVPVEVPGVIGVSANGLLVQKAWYSNYGVGVTQVVAPGGDSFFQTGAFGGGVFNGGVLSTYPAALNAGGLFDFSVSPPAAYRFLEGTSMAAPHVAGIAALILSRFGPMQPGQLQALINRTADPLPCPDGPFRFPFAPRPSGDPQVCQGGMGYNSFYGHGQVNAFEAVR
jgi:subtilisin family serine protease